MKRSELPEFIREAARRAQARVASGFDRVFLYEFEQLEQHLKSAEEKFLGDATALKQRVQDDVAAMDAEERDRYNEFFVEELSTVIDSLPRLQWYAEFLVAYSSFEYSLSQLCRIVQKRSHLSLAESDLGGKGIRRSAAYLSKLAGIKTPFQSTEWQHALLLGEIRNMIAHTNGTVDVQPLIPGSLYVRSSKLPGLSLATLQAQPERAQFSLTPEFIRFALADLQNVLVNVANYELYG